MQIDNPYHPPQTAASDLTRSESSRALGLSALATLFWCILLGGILGAVSRVVRDQIAGGTHYEAIGEFGIKILASILLLIGSQNRRFRDSFWRFFMQSSAIWLASAVTWTAVNGKPHVAYLQVNRNGWIISLIVGTVILYIIHSRQHMFDKATDL